MRITYMRVRNSLPKMMTLLLVAFAIVDAANESVKVFKSVRIRKAKGWSGTYNARELTAKYDHSTKQLKLTCPDFIGFKDIVVRRIHEPKNSKSGKHRKMLIELARFRDRYMLVAGAENFVRFCWENKPEIFIDAWPLETTHFPRTCFRRQQVIIVLDNDECLGQFGPLGVLYSLHKRHDYYNCNEYIDGKRNTNKGNYGDSSQTSLIDLVMKYYFKRRGVRPQLDKLFKHILKLKREGQVDKVCMYTSALNEKGWIDFLKICLERYAQTPGLYDEVFSRDKMESPKIADCGATIKDLLNVAIGSPECVKNIHHRDMETFKIIMFDDKPHNILTRDGIAVGVKPYVDMPAWEDIEELIKANEGLHRFVQEHWNIQSTTDLRPFKRVLVQDGLWPLAEEKNCGTQVNETIIETMIQQINYFVDMCHHTDEYTDIRRECMQCGGKYSAEATDKIRCNTCKDLGIVIDDEPDYGDNPMGIQTNCDLKKTFGDWVRQKDLSHLAKIDQDKFVDEHVELMINTFVRGRRTPARQKLSCVKKFLGRSQEWLDKRISESMAHLNQL